ncbi:metallophosphoesterase family protein [Persicirhabdus sediminis]|uniref:DNA repair exonuclease n=1 Tax=Persicirhabdus sediminis TaxID=454144 RepID=A0A8J7MBW9_9BACT|nr:DNA repair exonuclease [Persicirhabdus sediminis]MBK1790161.1 DNA repair exonuclease [Persicirhabdus sediminis]
MFRFIHTADIHLDSPLRGLNSHADAPIDQIRGASRRALESIVELAIDNQVHFLLIAGDLYDGDWPDFSTGLFFNQQMNKLKEANISVYLITGNHDAASKITKSLKPPANVTTLSSKKPESIIIQDLSVAIHGQGFATQSVPENLAITYPEALADHFNIGMLHTSLTGNIDHDPYTPCSLDDLASKGYDYWALGHIHKHEVVSKNPHVVYAGNPQGRHIRECGERGCYLIEVNDGLEIDKLDFLTTDQIRWQHLEINLTTAEEDDDLRELISRNISSALQSAQGRLLAIRITLFGDTHLHDQLHAEQAQWFAECQSIAEEIDGANIWLERLRLKTKPTYDPQELAERDELTKLVLDALGEFSPSKVPSPVAQLSSKLAGVNNQELKELLTLDDEDEQLKEDVTAIVLQSISSSAH